MRVLGFVAVPVLLESDSRVQNVVVCVVEGLLYGFIFGQNYFEFLSSTLAFAPHKEFSPCPRHLGSRSTLPS